MKSPTGSPKAALLCGLVLGTLALSACQPAVSLAQPALNPAAPPAATNPPALTASPTSLAGQDETAAQSTPSPTTLSAEEPRVTSTPDLLRFVFPTAGYSVRSAWRPPLYEVPWALGAFDHFYFSRPIAADQVNWPLWDYRYGGIFEGTDIVHTGIDIDAPYGTDVISAGAGKVVWSGYGLFYGQENENDPYGLAITIRHDFGYQGERLYTVYAHLSESLVQPGERIESGDIIGKVGNSGKTTGPHLHFEVRVMSNNFSSSRNPELWLAPPQGWGVLAGRVTNTGGRLLRHHEVRVSSQADGSLWVARTYGPTAVNSDPFYQENLVVSDLPAGEYTVRIEYLGHLYDQTVTIQPGLVTFFTFNGLNVYHLDPPPTPSVEELLAPSP